MNRVWRSNQKLKSLWILKFLKDLNRTMIFRLVLLIRWNWVSWFNFEQSEISILYCSMSFFLTDKAIKTVIHLKKFIMRARPEIVHLVASDHHHSRQQNAIKNWIKARWHTSSMSTKLVRGLVNKLELNWNPKNH